MRGWPTRRPRTARAPASADRRRRWYRGGMVPGSGTGGSGASARSHSCSDVPVAAGRRREMGNGLPARRRFVRTAAAGEDSRRLRPVRVRRDDRAHVAHPGGHVRAGGVSGQGPGVSQGEPGIPEPVPREHRGMHEPRPAPAGIFEEAPVDELEHHPLPGGVRHRAVQPCRREQGIAGPRIQIDDRVEPALHPAVVELHERNADPRLVVVRLEPEDEQLRERRFVAERGEAQDGGGRGRTQGLRLGPGIRLPDVPSDLHRERRRQHHPQRHGHRGDAALTGSRDSDGAHGASPMRRSLRFAAETGTGAVPRRRRRARTALTAPCGRGRTPPRRRAGSRRPEPVPRPGRDRRACRRRTPASPIR